MTGPVIQARIFASTNRQRQQQPQACTKSWTLPAWFLVMKSPSVLGGDSNDVILHSRIAKELGICDGDEVEFDLYELNQTCRFPVSVRENVSSDFTINGALHLGIIAQYEMDSRSFGERITTASGMKLYNIPNQKLFSGMKRVRRSSQCILFFDGGCRNNPEGPNGYGFHITTPSGEKLIQGFGSDSRKQSSNVM